MQPGSTARQQVWGITLLRVVTGTVFLGAGLQKLFLPEATQLPGPIVTVGSLVELLCGAALVVGLFTRWVSIPLALLMLADIVVFHPPYDLVEDDKGFEYAVLRLAAIVTLALSGLGKVALDNVLASRSGLR